VLVGRLTILGLAVVLALSAVGLALAEAPVLVGGTAVEPTAAPSALAPSRESAECAMPGNALDLSSSARAALSMAVRGGGEPGTDTTTACLVGTAEESP
jgi:hypothetical protein